MDCICMLSVSRGEVCSLFFEVLLCHIVAEGEENVEHEFPSAIRLKYGSSPWWYFLAA